MGLLGTEVFLSPIFLFVGSRPQPHDLPWTPKGRFEQLLIKGGTAKKPPVLTVVPSLSCIQLFATPWSAAHQASLSFTPRVCSNSCPLSWWCHLSISSSALLPLLLPSIFPSIRVFSNELALCIRWPKYWSSSFSISPSKEYSGLTSFRIDWFDLLAVQGTLKSLL